MLAVMNTLPRIRAGHDVEILDAPLKARVIDVRAETPDGVWIPREDLDALTWKAAGVSLVKFGIVIAGCWVMGLAIGALFNFLGIH